MPIFLDQSLRKAILSKIKDSFSEDQALAGQVKVLEQETFLPEAENQIILTDLQVTNDSLDSGNKLTELIGTVTFAPLNRPTVSFLSWVQENPRVEQLVDQGFYRVTTNKTEDPYLWSISTDVLRRVTEKRERWSGLQVYLDYFKNESDFDQSKLVIKQDLQAITCREDFLIVGIYIYLRRYVANTSIIYDGVDITDYCNYVDFVSTDIKLDGFNKPIKLPAGALLASVTVYDLEHHRPLKGWNLSQKGLITWRMPTYPKGLVRLQYYIKKPLQFWPIPDEFKIHLSYIPLVYADGLSSLVVASDLRGELPSSMYVVKDSTIYVLEPMPNESISIDYRTYVKTLGPTVVSPASFDDQVIPGLCLTFTDNFSDGDQAVIIKHDHKKSIGQENGGTNRVEVSLKLRSSDDRTLERMTARVYHLFTNQESLYELSNQGMSFENAISYSRSYEERDGNSDKWIVHEFRLVIHHTWHYLIPHITDLNSINIRTKFIVDSKDTGAPTFKDILLSSTPDNWVQDY